MSALLASLDPFIANETFKALTFSPPTDNSFHRGDDTLRSILLERRLDARSPRIVQVLHAQLDCSKAHDSSKDCPPYLIISDTLHCVHLFLPSHHPKGEHPSANHDCSEKHDSESVHPKYEEFDYHLFGSQMNKDAIKRGSCIKIQNYSVSPMSEYTGESFSLVQPLPCNHRTHPSVCWTISHRTNAVNSTIPSREPLISVLGGDGSGIVGSPVDVHEDIDIKRALNLLPTYAELVNTLKICKEYYSDTNHTHSRKRPRSESKDPVIHDYKNSMDGMNLASKKQPLGNVEKLLQRKIHPICDSKLPPTWSSRVPVDKENDQDVLMLPSSPCNAKNNNATGTAKSSIQEHLLRLLRAYETSQENSKNVPNEHIPQKESQKDSVMESNSNPSEDTLVHMPLPSNTSSTPRNDQSNSVVHETYPKEPICSIPIGESDRRMDTCKEQPGDLRALGSSDKRIFELDAGCNLLRSYDDEEDSNTIHEECGFVCISNMLVSPSHESVKDRHRQTNQASLHPVGRQSDKKSCNETSIGRTNHPILQTINSSTSLSGCSSHSDKQGLVVEGNHGALSGLSNSALDSCLSPMSENRSLERDIQKRVLSVDYDKETVVQDSELQSENTNINANISPETVYVDAVDNLSCPHGIVVDNIPSIRVLGSSSIHLRKSISTPNDNDKLRHMCNRLEPSSKVVNNDTCALADSGISSVPISESITMALPHVSASVSYANNSMARVVDSGVLIGANCGVQFSKRFGGSKWQQERNRAKIFRCHFSKSTKNK